jgi:hypothetical protein
MNCSLPHKLKGWQLMIQEHIFNSLPSRIYSVPTQKIIRGNSAELKDEQ